MNPGWFALGHFVKGLINRNSDAAGTAIFSALHQE
jgi:hypothetical protein